MKITETLFIGEDEIDETFIRSSGPGGQNVNTGATAVQIRFNVRRCRALFPETQDRLLRLAGSRATDDGVIVITAREHRSQDRNRTEARERLRGLILQALAKPKKRRKTRPTRSAIERLIGDKKRRSEIKANRH